MRRVWSRPVSTPSTRGGGSSSIVPAALPSFRRKVVTPDIFNPGLESRSGGHASGLDPGARRGDTPVAAVTTPDSGCPGWTFRRGDDPVPASRNAAGEDLAGAT